MLPFKLEIITQEKEVWNGTAESVSVTTIDGEITVLARHIPFVSVLKPAEIVIRNAGKEDEEIAGTGGIVEVTPEKMMILADSAVRVEEIDEEKAREAKERAEKLMEEKLSDREAAEVSAELRRALLHLNIAHKRRGRRK